MGRRPYTEVDDDECQLVKNYLRLERKRASRNMARDESPLYFLQGNPKTSRYKVDGCLSSPAASRTRCFPKPPIVLQQQVFFPDAMSQSRMYSIHILTPDPTRTHAQITAPPASLQAPYRQEKPR